MKHDESTDVRLLSRIAKINPVTKTIIIPESTQIGNKRWGRIDFLVHYCGYHLARPDGAIMSNSQNAEKERNRRENDTRKNKRNNRNNRKYDL